MKKMILCAIIKLEVCKMFENSYGYLWEYTLPTKQNVIEYLRYILYPTIALAVFLIVIVLTQIISWCIGILIFGIYLILFLLLFIFTGIFKPTTYIIDAEFFAVIRGNERWIMNFDRIKGVHIKQKKYSTDIIFKLKAGLSLNYNFKGILDKEYAQTAYELIEGSIIGKFE